MKKLILLVILFVGLYFGGRILLHWDRPNSDSDVRVSFEIPRGSNLDKISEMLDENGLIQDAFVFRLYSRWNKLSESFQAGEYVLQKNLTFAEIAEVLQHGKTSEIRITIPEGFTIAQIDDLLARKSLINAGEFLDCTNFCDLGFRVSSLEGYLFPSTYYVTPKNFSAKSFITRLYNTFQNQITPLKRDIAQTGYTLDQIVIMASMIEREAITPEEMPQIADVLWKRLDEGIPLGVDATTRFALNEWNRPLYTEDFETDSPYNTRRKRGLPPTAISNPGIEAIKAAIYPEANPYYYYLHDKTGQIHFSENHDQHVQKKNKYLR